MRNIVASIVSGLRERGCRAELWAGPHPQVCRHHAAAVAAGSGRATQFRCPYHDWTYDLSGRLQKAVALRGIEGFRAADQGLVPVETATLGPWLFGRVGGSRCARCWLGFVKQGLAWAVAVGWFH